MHWPQDGDKEDTVLVDRHKQVGGQNRMESGVLAGRRTGAGQNGGEGRALK